MDNYINYPILGRVIFKRKKMANADQLNSQKQLFGHPVGLYVLFFTELWERFSYYGMRALLSLYVATSAMAIDPGLGWSTKDAIWLYGWYTMLVYVAAIPGGWIADKFLGQKRTVMYGGFLLCIGHGILAVPTTWAFFTGLILIILGVGGLKPNISTMVGGLYEQGDVRRDSGFTIFYIGINIGAFLSSIVVGLVDFEYGWHYGFGLAGIGMLLGQIVFIYGQKYLLHVGNFLGNSDNKEEKEIMNNPLSKVEVDRIIVLLISFLIVIVFWGAFEQAGGLMNLYTDSKVDRVIGLSFLNEVPAAVFQSLNAGYIILFGTLIGAFWLWWKKKGFQSSSLFKMAIGTIIMGLGYIFMMFASLEASEVEFGKAAMIWVFLAYLFHTIGELCTSPVALSYITKLAPIKYASIMMGVYFAATGFGNKLAGSIGETSQLEEYKAVSLLEPLIRNFGAEVVVDKEIIYAFQNKDTIVVKEIDASGNKIINKKFAYQIDFDNNFSLKSKLYLDENKLTFIDNDQKLEINHLFKIDIEDSSSLIKYLKDNKVTKENPNHVILKFEKDSEKAKMIQNRGDGKDYEVSFVIEEQQSAQEYKIFKFLTIFTVSFGLLLILFIKRLNKLAHGAE
jgi:proton-dependent oligopeptide transporter, POT family